MALDRDRDPGRAPIHAALEGLAMSHDHKPSIVLAELWEGAKASTGTPASPASGVACRWRCCATASARTRRGPTRRWSCGGWWRRSVSHARAVRSHPQGRQNAIRGRDGEIGASKRWRAS
jgi:hypothetical protein